MVGNINLPISWSATQNHTNLKGIEGDQKVYSIRVYSTKRDPWNMVGQGQGIEEGAWALVNGECSSLGWGTQL